MGARRALAVIVRAGVVMKVVVMGMAMIVFMVMVVMMPIAFDAHFAFAATAHVTHVVPPDALERRGRYSTSSSLTRNSSPPVTCN